MKKIFILFLTGILFTLISCSKTTVTVDSIEDEDNDSITFKFHDWEDGGTEDIEMFPDGKAKQ